MTHDIDTVVRSFYSYPKHKRLAMFEKMYKKAMFAIREGLNQNEPAAVEQAKQLNKYRQKYIDSESSRDD